MRSMKQELSNNNRWMSFAIAALLLSACAAPPASTGNNPGVLPAATIPAATQVATRIVPTPTAERAILIRPAQIEGLDVQILESMPVQVKATINGTLGDGCTSLNAITQKRTGNTFGVEVTTKRPAEAMCTMIAKLYNETISLDVAGLSAGTYIVSAGTLSQTFKLNKTN